MPGRKRAGAERQGEASPSKAVTQPARPAPLTLAPTAWRWWPSFVRWGPWGRECAIGNGLCRGGRNLFVRASPAVAQPQGLHWARLGQSSTASIGCQLRPGYCAEALRPKSWVFTSHTHPTPMVACISKGVASNRVCVRGRSEHAGESMRGLQRQSVVPMPRFPEKRCLGILVPMNRSPSPLRPSLCIFFWAWRLDLMALLFISRSRKPSPS